MLRLAELGFILVPLALLAIYLVLARHGGPSRGLIAAIVAMMVVGEAGLGWYALHERLPAGARYVPAHMENGRIVEGHGR